jgi:ribonuclease E
MIQSIPEITGFASSEIKIYRCFSTPCRFMDGNYLAKVVRAEPALQGAFVEFGGVRHGFLPFNEIHSDYYQIPPEQRRELVDRLNHAARNPTIGQLEIQFGEVEDHGGDRGSPDEPTRGGPVLRSNGFKIQDVIKRRQVMLVQVTKDETANKGALLTTFISIASRVLVLTPNTAMEMKVSARISNPEDRLRMTQLDLVGRFLGSNRMLAGTEVVKCPCEMRAWSLSTKVLL